MVRLVMQDENGDRWFIAKSIEITGGGVPADARSASEANNPNIPQNFAAYCDPCVATGTVEFNAIQLTYDIGQPIVTTYDWAFGDGTYGDENNSAVTHAYAKPGTYNVTLTMTDSANNKWFSALPGARVQDRLTPAQKVTSSSQRDSPVKICRGSSSG